MKKSRANRGMTLIEIAMALSLLSLVAVMLVGSITVISRRDVTLVNQRATANGLAVKYLEMQRAQVRVSSLQALADKTIAPPDVIDGVTYSTTINFTQGRILLADEVIAGTNHFAGDFVSTSTDPMVEGPVYMVGGKVAPNAAVKVAATVSWGTRSLVLESIMVPRDN